MSSIPEALSKRFELLQQLEKAYDLLNTLQSTGKDTDVEESFLKEKINSIERILEGTEPEAENTINHLREDPVAWTVARLRFIQGYEWAYAASRSGISEDAAKSRIYRFFKKLRQEKIIN